MKILMVFIAIMAVLIYFVWPSSNEIVIGKNGFETYKEDTKKEFDEYKSKN